MTFEDELRQLINRFSLENESNTPDFILADYMCHCLSVFNMVTKRREKWYGKELKIDVPTTLENKNGE